VIDGICRSTNIGATFHQEEIRQTLGLKSRTHPTMSEFLRRIPVTLIRNDDTALEAVALYGYRFGSLGIADSAVSEHPSREARLFAANPCFGIHLP